MIQAVPWDYRPFAWVNERVLFTARVGDVTHVWQVLLSPVTYKATGELQELTSGTGFDAYPSMIQGPQGHAVLAFASTVASINVCGLPIGAHTGLVTGEPAQITQAVATWLSYPSVSADGTKLTHLFVRAKERAWLLVRDLRTGRSATVSPNPPSYPYARLTADGSQIAYRNEEDGREAIYVLDADVRRLEIPASRVCDDCGRPMDWSPDKRKLLFGTRRAPSSIAVLDMRSRERTELLAHPGLDLQAARFSPSGDWIAFCARTESGGRIFIAKFDPAKNQTQESWIGITGNAERDLVPAWSQDGNLLYMLSDRDGYRCIWAQRLDPTTKMPHGTGFAIRHFHQPRHSLGSGASPGILLRHAVPEGTGLEVTADRLIFSVDDLSGNIWLAKWK